MNISIVAEPIFWIGAFPFTNAFIMTLVVSIGIAAGSVFLSRRLADVPGRWQNAVESVVEGLWNLVDDVTRSKELSKIFFPLVATLFLFILFSNWFGLLPGAATVGIREHGMIVPFIRAGTADLNTTIALSLITVFAVQFVGISVLGLRGYAKKFFVSPLHKPYVLGSIVGLLELMGEATKIVSFSFRLFGNVFAGEVLLIVIGNLVPYVVPLPFLFLEVFVGVVQAGVFAILTLVFLKMATVPAGH